jgi:hypothetical protein
MRQYAGTMTLYWAGRNSRWHRYDNVDPGTTDEFLNESPKTPPTSSGA